MKTADFIREHDACRYCAKWALSVSKDMADVWDAMIKQNKHDWLLWAATRPGVLPAPTLRRLACRFVRETPLADGRNVWDLLTDERSRMAVEVAEASAEGKATADELVAAWAALAARDAATCAATTAARAAAKAARAAASRATDAAYAAAVYAAAASYAAARATDTACATDTARAADCAAKSAQIKMIAELGNPFNKGE